MDHGKADSGRGLPLKQKVVTNHDPSPTSRSNYTSSTSSVSLSKALRASPSPSRQSSIDNIAETYQNSTACQQRKQYPSAALARGQTGHCELCKTSSYSHHSDSAKPASLRQDQLVDIEQAGNGIEKGVKSVSKANLEEPADRLCQYEYEDYKHMIHMKWVDKPLEASSGG